MSFSPSKHSRLLCAWSSPSLPSTVPMTSRPPRSAESTADWATATAVSATEASATVDTTVVPWATEPDTTAVLAVWADTTVDTTADTQVAVPNRTHLSSQFVLTHRSSLCRIPRRRWILRWCPRPRIPRIRRTRIPRTALNGEQCERVISSEGTSRQRHCGQVPNCKKGCSCFLPTNDPNPPNLYQPKATRWRLSNLVGASRKTKSANTQTICARKEDLYYFHCTKLLPLFTYCFVFTTLYTHQKRYTVIVLFVVSPNCCV